MSYAIQWLRSLVFAGQMYLAMLVIGILYLPWAILSPDGAVAACHAFCRYVRWSAAGLSVCGPRCVARSRQTR